ncbi:MAG: hypothetical protein AB1295_05865 [Candidatus Micrarchaeota archaeon]
MKPISVLILAFLSIGLVHAITVEPNEVVLREGGSGATVMVSGTIEGEGAILLQPPTCSPDGVTVSPSGSVSISESPFEAEYVLRGSEGTYSCSVTATDANGGNPSTATFSANVGEECALKPINNQVLDKDACVLTCPLVCDEGDMEDYDNCLCIPKSTSVQTPCSSSFIVLGIGLLSIGVYKNWKN